MPEAMNVPGATLLEAALLQLRAADVLHSVKRIDSTADARVALVCPSGRLRRRLTEHLRALVAE